MTEMDRLTRRTPGAAGMPMTTLAGATARPGLPPDRRRPQVQVAAPPRPVGRLVDALLGDDRLAHAEWVAAKWGVHPLEAAVSLRLTSPEAVADLLAARLGGRRLPEEAMPTLIGPQDDWPAVAARGAIAVDLPGHGMAILVAPRPAEAEAMAARRHRVRPGPWPIFVTTPEAFAGLIRAWAEEPWADQAVNGLARAHPEASAHDRALMTRAAHGVTAAVGCIFLAMAFGPAWLQFGLGVALGLIVSLWASVQVLAACSGLRPLACEPLADRDLPHYTVLCTLYKEAPVAASLLAALDALDYPAAKLDIKLVLEADDPETLAAIQAAPGRLPVEMLVLPDIAPRTKPKALMMALPFARGDLLVVYDAEDRPGRGQLREAAETFAAGPQTLGCLQAPLSIHNAEQNWLTRFFAAEYDALFRVVLPALARYGLPIPLGGTSNHFRVEALKQAGGWDPFNVTEDADLGVRLALAGWQVGTIATPTLEEAPPLLKRWLGQRGRWFKGWLQTMAVLGRRPVALARALGPKGLLGLLATLVGSIGSALIHLPTLVPLLAWSAVEGLPPFASLAMIVLLTGYGASMACQAVGLVRGGHAGLIPWLALVPGLWVIAGIAAMRAVHELATRPFHWEKTTHGLSHGFAPPPDRSRALAVLQERAPMAVERGHDPAVIAEVIARHRALAAAADVVGTARLDVPQSALMQHSA